MTAQDKARFVACFNALAVSLRLSPDEVDAVQQGVYFEALGDLPIAAVEASVRVLQRQAGSFFPTTAEWYRVADDLAVQALVADETPTALPAATSASFDRRASIRAARDRFVTELRAMTVPGVDWSAIADRVAQWPIRVPRDPSCADCQDTGWVTHVCCDGARCGNPDHDDREWGEHGYVVRCLCLSHNPTIARRLAAATQRRGAQPTKTRLAR